MARTSIPFSEIERTISTNIRALREKWRMSQAEFAEKVGSGWTATTVSKIETIDGKNSRHLSADELVRVAKVLAVEVDVITRKHVAGSPEFVNARRAGEAFADAVEEAVRAANDALYRANQFTAAQEKVPAGEFESLEKTVRDSYEEILTFYTRPMLDALENVPKTHHATYSE